MLLHPPERLTRLHPMKQILRFSARVAAAILLPVVMALPAQAQSTTPPASSPTPLPQPEASPQTSASSATAFPAANASSSPVYHFVTGKSTVYRLKYQSKAKADLRVLFAGQNAGQEQASGLNYDLSATLQSDVEVTTTHADGKGAENFYVFQSPAVRLVVNGNDQTAQANEVAATLAQGLLVVLNPEGKITALYLPPQAGKFSQDFARTLLAALQFVLPEASQHESASWTATEADRNGPYIARYRVANGSASLDDVVIHKSKLRYLPVSATMTGENLPGKTDARKTVKPKMDFTAHFISQTGQLTSLSGTEVLDTAVEDKNVAHSETTLALTQTSASKLPGASIDRDTQAAAALKTNSQPLILFAQKSRSEVESSIQRTELGSATLPDLMARLNSISDDQANPDKQQTIETPVYLKFKALIYVHPETCAQLGQTLAAAKVSSPAFRILSGSLGAVGHRQAQAALAHALASHAQDSVAQASLIATLGGVPHPTAESEKTLREVALNAPDQNAAGTAMLALGSMAHSLQSTEPARASSIVDFLLQRASSAGALEEKQAALQALGNSSSSRALPLLMKLAGSETAGIRSAAVDALRNIPQPQVDPLLRHILLADAEAQVRLEAAFALGFRKTSLESFNAQKKAFAAEADDKVRGALLDNLAKMRKKFPEVLAILTGAAKDDPSEYVRKEAAGLLGTLPPPPPPRK
jgi:hypothetical protein